MSFFAGPNPFASQVGQLIDTATDPSDSEKKIELFFEVCDLINTDSEVAKDAMRAMRKKLNIFSGKNWTVVMKILKLLEICSNNCNRKFQIHLANKDFLHELKSMIGPKLQPPMVIQEKVLYLIQKWANMFMHDHEFKAIEHYYNELKQKGIDFPTGTTEQNEELKSGDDLYKKIPSVTRTTVSPSSNPSGSSQNLKSIVPGSAAAVRLNEDQTGKLKSELDIVENNILVMNEVLNVHQPNNSKKTATNSVEEDICLLKELFVTTNEMQKRITQLIGNVANENIIGDLLRINDDLNNVFVRYERFQKGSNFAPPTTKSAPTQKPEEKSLINFDDDGTSTSSINIDFLNNNTKTSTNVKSSSDDQNQFLEDENEIAEMENWLKTQELQKGNKPQ